MSCRLEVEGSHVLGLDDSIHECEIIQQYWATIIAWDGDDSEGGSIVGNAEFYIVKVGAAQNCDISLMDAIVSVNQDVYDYGAAVLDPDTGDLRADLAERLECMSGDLMFLHLMKVLPAHRGSDIGLVAASRLIESYASGLVICRPQPLQYVGDEPEVSGADGMEYERFSKDRREAKRKLQKYWSRLGFEPISDDGVYALGTASAALREGTRRAEAAAVPSQLTDATKEPRRR